MAKSHVPATYENFELLRELATRLIWDNQLQRGFSQLEHAGYILSAIHADEFGGEMRYLGEAADITDDMCCIQEKLGNNPQAFKYQELRLQTLTNLQSPLVSFLDIDPKDVEEGGDHILVLRDSYSTMAAFGNKNGVELQLDGQVALALSVFESTENFLRHCALFSDNHVQMKNTRRNIASALRALKRDKEAVPYEAKSKLPHIDNAAENTPYTNFKKIFIRLTPGGVPELYRPTGIQLDATTHNNKEEIQRLATKLLLLQKPLDETKKKVLQEIQHEARKRSAKTSKNTQQPKTPPRIPATYENFQTVRELAKKLCHEHKFSEALSHLEHAAYILSQLNVREAIEDGQYADEAADVVDDMACILQQQGDYKKAFMYEMIRLQTITGLEVPLEVSFFVRHDGKDDGLYDQVLTDTHSALFTILHMEALKMQREGDLPKAFKSFESALAMLDRCFLIPDNYVQMRNTRRNMASVLRSMNRPQEADKYEDERLFRDYKVIGPEVPTYTNKNKIFFRPVHGGPPELYVPPDAAATDSEAGPALHRQPKSAEQNAADKKKHDNAFHCLRSLAAMEFARKTEDADRAMQELLEEEEQAKKSPSPQHKVSKRDKKKKIKTKQAQDRNEDAERVLQELVQEQQDIATCLLPLRLSPSPSPAALSPPALPPVPPPPVLPRPSVPRPSVPRPSVPRVVSLAPPPPSLPRLVSLEPPPSLAPPQDSDLYSDKIAAHLEHFVCPISLEIMQDPVITADGYTFERARIEAWFKHHNTNPLTNVELHSKALIPNKLLKSVIVNAQDLQTSFERGGAGAM